MRQALLAGTVDILDAGRAAFGGGRLKAVVRTVMILVASLDFTVAMALPRVDRPDEGVGVDDRRDVENCMTSSSGDARHDVFAIRRGRRQDMAVSPGERDHQRRHIFRQRVFIGGAVSHQHLGDTGDFGGRVDRRARRCRRPGHGSRPNLGGRPNGIQRRRLQALVIVFGNDQDAHLNHLRFGPEFFDKGRHVFDHLTGLAAGRLFDLQNLQTRRRIDAEIGRRDLVDGLFFAFMIFGKEA